MRSSHMDRRGFIKVSGAAAVAATGIEGIVTARRAPAHAQGTKLHIVRWVDFIPEADVELKRQMPDALPYRRAECADRPPGARPRRSGVVRGRDT